MTAITPAGTASGKSAFADLLALTLAAHRAQCCSCGPRGLELCETGLHLENAARPDRGWCPNPNGDTR